MLFIERYEARRHIKREFDVIPSFPRALNPSPRSRLQGSVDFFPVYFQHTLPSHPGGYAKSDEKVFLPVGLHMDCDFAMVRIFRLLRKNGARAPLLPRHAGRYVEIYVHSFRTAKVGADSIIGSQLRECA